MDTNNMKQELIDAAQNIVVYYGIDLEEHNLDFLLKVLSSTHLGGSIEGIQQAREVMEDIDATSE